MADLLVVGAGLIGTSVALALRGRSDVLLHDEDAAALDVAVRRSGARRWDGVEGAALVVAAVPAAAVAAVLQRVAREATTFTHVSSVQAEPQRQVETLLGQDDRFCGSHPMAGRETTGPAGARADLFEGRPWAVCPAPWTSPAAQEQVLRLARACGATPAVLPAVEHDAAVALVSHLPQVVASALAARLLQAPAATRLSGPGLQDTTRLAATTAAWWPDVLSANATALAPLLSAVADDLAALADALPGEDGRAAAGELLERGRQGRALVPGKRGTATEAFAAVAVELPDEPGALAALLVAAAEAAVNVEDVRVDHAPGTPRGTVELSVRPEHADRLRAALRATGALLV